MAKEIKDVKEIFQEKHGTIIMTESLSTRTKIKMSSLIKFQKNKTQFILCDCANEILFVEYDEEYEMADIAIFETRSSFEASKSWYQKLRYCYRILTGKDAYSDQMMLTKDQMRQLKDFLESVL